MRNVSRIHATGVIYKRANHIFLVHLNTSFLAVTDRRDTAVPHSIGNYENDT